METCPICTNRIIPSWGFDQAHLLIVSDFPTKEELENHAPIAGWNLDCIQYELGRNGLAMQQFRVASLWNHFKPKKIKENSGKLLNCFDQTCFPAFIREITNPDIKAVLMLGDDLPGLMGYPKLDKISGVPFTYLPSLGLPLDCVFAPRISYARNTSLGEFRLAIQKFCTLVKDKHYV